MRHFCLLLSVLLSLPLSGQEVDDLKVTVQFEDIPLTEAISYLEKKYGLSFSFPRREVEAVRVNCSFQGAGWATVEQCLFGLHHLAANRLADGYVSLRPMPPGTVREWKLALSVIGENELPLPFTTISAPAAAQNTDEEGRFAGTLLAAPEEEISFSFIGYETIKLPLRELLAGPPPTIYLKDASVELGTVRILDYLADGIETGGGSIVLTPSQTPPVPGFAAAEVLRTVALIPGVTSLNESAASLSIRGSNRDQSLLLWDGIPIYGNGYFFGMVSPFHTELVGSVDVYRGQTEAARGGRVAGVIDLQTDDRTTQHFEAGASVSLLDVQAHVKAPLFKGRSDLQLSGRGSPGLLFGGPVYQSYREQVFQSEALENLLSTPDSPRVTGKETFSFNEFSGRWRYDFGKGRTLKLSGLYASDQFSYTSEAERVDIRYADQVTSGNNGVSLNYDHPVGRGKLQLELAHSAFVSEGTTDFVNLRNEVSNARKSGIRERSARLEYQLTDARFNQLTLGVQAQEYDNLLRIDYTNLRADSSLLFNAPGKPTIAAAAYGQYDRAINEDITAQIGFRLQQYEPTGKVYPEPRLGLRYALAEDWSAQANYTLSHQFPQEVINLDPQRISALSSYWVLADGARLPVAAGRESSFGLTGRPHAWLFDVQAYHRRVDGITSLNSVFQRDGVDKGEARSMGVDVLVQRKWPGLRAWGIYTLSRTEWRFQEMSPEYFPADNDRRHQLQLMASYRKKAWSVVGGWRWQSGAPFTEVTSVLTRIRPNSNRFNTELVSSGPNAERLPTYHRLDLTVAYDWETRPGGWAGSVTLSVLNGYGRENLLERRYLLEAENPARPRMLTARAIDRVGLGTTFNLGVRVGVGG